MYYALENRNGDIGEYYFAYWITKTFGWPCRLVDIDLGLDAQIEICNGDHEAIGQFIAVQIKSTDSKKMSVSLKLNNLKYWKEVREPVVIVRIINVSSAKPALYWKIINTKEIDALIERAEASETKMATLKFSEKYRLTAADETNFRSLPALKNIEVLEEASRILRGKYSKYLSMYFDNEREEYDLLSSGCDDDFVEDFNFFCFELEKVREIDHLPEIVEFFGERVPEFEGLEKIYDDFRKLVIDYIRSLKANSQLHVLQKWKEHPYHSDLAYIVENIDGL